MNIVFEKMENEHQSEVMKIFNYYIENSTSAFPNMQLPEQFFSMLLKKSEKYTSYVLKDIDKDLVIGFCQLGGYSPFSTFKNTSTLTYFISKDYTRQGLGVRCLEKLEDDAKNMGIKNLIAEISSENEASIAFHKKNGFSIVGELKDIGEKFDRVFSVVYMQKKLK